VKAAAVYITTNRANGTLYTGVTANLAVRMIQHRTEPTGFVRRYGCSRLVHVEFFELITEAIAREKQIKAGSRQKKIALIESINPTWRDLYDDLPLL